MNDTANDKPSPTFHELPYYYQKKSSASLIIINWLAAIIAILTTVLVLVNIYSYAMETAVIHFLFE